MKKFLSVFGLLALNVANSFAAVPAEVTTALDDAKTDVTTVVTSLLLISIAVFGLWIIKGFFGKKGV